MNIPSSSDKEHTIHSTSQIISNFLSQYQITSLPSFIMYLSQIWRDLSIRTKYQTTRNSNTSSPPTNTTHTNVNNVHSKGISRIAFSLYYRLPGLISIRLFNVFDKNKDNTLSPKEFIEGMITLFTEPLDTLLRFVFTFYDFDNDGLIKREDVQVVLAYIPVPSDFNALSKLDDELYEMFNVAFGENECINYEQYKDIVLYSKVYAMFVPLILFLYEKKPFLNEEIYNIYNHIDKESNNINGDVKYTIKNCVCVEEKEIDMKKKSNNNNNNINSNRDGMKGGTVKGDIRRNWNEKGIMRVSNYKRMTYETKGVFNHSPEYNMRNSTNNNNIYNNLFNRDGVFDIDDETNCNSNDNKNQLLSSSGFRELCNTVPSLLKSTKIMKDIHKSSLKQIEHNNSFNNLSLTDNDKSEFANEYDNDNDNDDDDDEYGGIKYDMKPKLNLSSETDIQNTYTCESYLYKLTPCSQKIKKLYYKLIGQDLFYFKKKTSLKHKGMHNLSGYFLECSEENINNSNDNDNTEYYVFSLSIPGGKVHSYYTNSKNDYDKWITILSKLLHTKNINDYYEIKEQIGRGKFSVVNLGLDIQTNKKYAIKTINKSNLLPSDLELIKIEIDILKICQHPYVVKLYDVIETSNTIYLITEYCAGGNLFSYFEKRHFSLEEPRIVDLVHKIATAVYSMHHLGIVHRDLKLSNIVMTDTTNNASLRILDFGLGKILGPGEKCNESFGTVGYAAPEVIQENQYDFKADIWSLGVITYFLFTGKLPFDYVSPQKGKVDAIYNTVYNDVDFSDNERWSKVSQEGKKFVMDLLVKDVNKRLNIKEVLEHEWIKKFYKEITERRKSSNKSTTANGMKYYNGLMCNNDTGGCLQRYSTFKMYATIGGQ